MRVVRRVALWTAGLLAVLVVVVIALVLTLTQTAVGHRITRQIALHFVGRAVHGQVQIGEIRGNLFRDITIDSIAITDSAGAPFVAAHALALHYSLHDLLRRRLSFFRIRLDHPVVVLTQAADGVWNFARIFPSDSTKPPSRTPSWGSWITLRDVRITDGTVTVQQAASPHTIVSGGLNTTLPYVLLADPRAPGRVAQVASLQTDFTMAPLSTAHVRDVAGTFYLAKDSLWWPSAAVRLPGSRLDGPGRYTFSSGDLALAIKAHPLAFADVRFAAPQLPREGLASADVRVTWRGATQRYRVQNLAASVGTAQARGRAEIEQRGGDSLRVLSSDLTFAGIDRHTLAQIAPGVSLPPALDGTFSGHVSGNGSPNDTLQAQLTVTQARRTTTRQLQATLHGSLHRLALQTTLTADNGGTLTVQGTVDVSARSAKALERHLGYDVAVTTHDLDLADLIPAQAHTSLNTHVAAVGHGLTPDVLNAQISADARSSVYDTLRVDSAQIRATIANGVVNVDSSHIRAFASTADVHGTLGLDAQHSGALQYHVSTDSLSSVLHRDSLAGHVVLTGTVTGSTKQFDLNGSLDASHLLGFGVTIAGAHAQYAWHGGPSLAVPIDVSAHLNAVAFANVAVDTLVVHAAYRKPDGQVDVTAYRPAGHTLATTVAFSFVPKGTEVRYSKLAVRADSMEWDAAQPGRVAWGSQGVTAEHIDLRATHDSSRLFLDGTLPLGASPSSPAHLQVKADQFSLRQLAAIMQRSFGVSGLVSADANISGTGGAPKIEGTAQLVAGTYDSTALPTVHLTFDYDTAWLAARARLDRSAAFDSLVRRSDSAQWAKIASRPVLLATAGIPLNLALDAKGPRLLDRPMRADVDADTIPLEIIPLFVPEVTLAQGNAHAHVHVRGTPHAPVVTGGIVLTDGVFRIATNGITLRQVATNVRLLGDSLVVDSLVARTQGWIRVRGLLDLSDRSVPVLDLTMSAHNARVLKTREMGLLDIDDSLSAAGPLSAPYVSGTVTVRDGVLYIPDVGGKQIIDVNSGAVTNVADTSNPKIQQLVSARSPILKHLRMDVDVSLNQNTWVRNRDANVEVYTDAPLTVRMNPDQDALVVDGVANTDRGQYTFLTKRFDITKGTVVFIGTPELNPTLELTGRYTTSVPGRQPLNILVLIGGTMLRPTLTLSSDAQPPMSQTDLFTMLAFGSPASQLSIGGSGSGGSSAGGASASGVSPSNLAGSLGPYVAQRVGGLAVGTMTGELQEGLAHSLGADLLNITPAPGVPTDVSTQGIAGYLRNTEIQFGKYFSPQTYIGLSLTPIAPPGASVQQQISRHTVLSLTLQPWYLSDPSLSPSSQVTTKDVLGISLTKQWKF